MAVVADKRTNGRQAGEGTPESTGPAALFCQSTTKQTDIVQQHQHQRGCAQLVVVVVMDNRPMYSGVVNQTPRRCGFGGWQCWVVRSGRCSTAAVLSFPLLFLLVFLFIISCTSTPETAPQATKASGAPVSGEMNCSETLLTNEGSVVARQNQWPTKEHYHFCCSLTSTQKEGQKQSDSEEGTTPPPLPLLQKN